MNIHRTTEKSLIVRLRGGFQHREDAIRLIVSGVVSRCDYCSGPGQDFFHEPTLERFVEYADDFSDPDRRWGWI